MLDGEDWIVPTAWSVEAAEPTSFFSATISPVIQSTPAANTLKPSCDHMAMALNTQRDADVKEATRS